VINLLGNVVPVVDLSARFGRASSTVTRRTCIVIIEANNEGEKQDIGVVVDSVSEVLEIPAAENRACTELLGQYLRRLYQSA
jgi:purine-binding chemotaxis protein CheW